MVKWEYAIYRQAPEDMTSYTDKLNEYGERGWECFSSECTLNGRVWWFKRPITYTKQV